MQILNIRNEFCDMCCAADLFMSTWKSYKDVKKWSNMLEAPIFFTYDYVKFFDNVYICFSFDKVKSTRLIIVFEYDVIF